MQGKYCMFRVFVYFACEKTVDRGPRGHSVPKIRNFCGGENGRVFWGAPSSPRFPLQIRRPRGWGGSATRIPSLITGRTCVADPPHPRVGRICNGNRELDGDPKKRARFHHHRNYGFSVHCDPWDTCRLFFRKRNEQKRKTCSISPVIRNVFIVSTSRNIFFFACINCGFPPGILRAFTQNSVPAYRYAGTEVREFHVFSWISVTFSAPLANP